MLNDSLAEKEFFGRTEVLSLLDKRVDALREGFRQNIAITGQRLSGKTCLLHHFLDNIKDPFLLPIYVEVVDEPFAAFAERLMGTILYTFLRMKGEIVREDFAYLLERAQPFMPQTVTAILHVKEELGKGDYDKAYLNILNLTSIVKRETLLRCIVIFDEFQNLSSFAIKDPFMHFGKVIMIQKDTMYIISSSDKAAIQDILAEKLALLFGNFEIVELRGFDFSASREFLDRKLDGFVLNDGLRSFAVAFTDGNPFYLDLLSAKLRDFALASSTNIISTKIMVDAIEGLFFDSKGTVNQYFTNYISNLGLNATSMNVLAAISKGLHTLKEIREAVSMSFTEVSSRLRMMIESNILCKTGNFYFFSDRGFLFWIREVRERRRSSLISSATMRSEQFKHDMHGLAGRFLFDLRKDCGHRVADLFSKFKGEIVEVGEKRHRLPQFKKVDAISLNRTNRLLLAHKDKDLWVSFIKEGRMCEDDVVSFMDEIKKLKPKVINKILIALDGIDINATLLAKECRMWIWSLKKLNTVMDIYNQEKIIRYGRKAEET